jgi:hypothetical protein
MRLAPAIAGDRPAEGEHHLVRPVGRLAGDHHRGGLERPGHAEAHRLTDDVDHDGLGLGDGAGGRAHGERPFAGLRELHVAQRAGDAVDDDEHAGALERFSRGGQGLDAHGLRRARLLRGDDDGTDERSHERAS